MVGIGGGISGVLAHTNQLVPRNRAAGFRQGRERRILKEDQCPQQSNWRTPDGVVKSGDGARDEEAPDTQIFRRDGLQVA